MLPYYHTTRRFSPFPATMSAYRLMLFDWTKTNNKLGEDFNLYVK